MILLTTTTAPQLTYDAFRKAASELESLQVVGVIVDDNSSFPDWDPRRTALPTWTREQLMDVTAHAAPTPFHDHYEEVLASLLADPRSFYLIERWYGPGIARSVFNNTLRIEQLVWNSLATLYHTQPDRIVAACTPHDITWFFARLAELIGIPSYFVATSPLPWRCWVVAGLDEQLPLEVPPTTERRSGPSMERLNSFLRNGRSSYDLAMPEYERRRLKRYKGGFFRPAIEIRSIFSSLSPRGMLWRAYAILKKRTLLRAYAGYSASYSTPTKYIAFFLHYQPERTTLPEGKKYVQQWLAIRSLAAALPAGWFLVVKEHPSTYRYRFSPTVRDVRFYEAINALPNARLAPLDKAAFELIDKSQAVATVTGTVGIESLIRGKPVLAFGAAQYRNAKGVFTIRSIDDIRIAVDQIARAQVVPSDSELLDYFSWVERNSFPCEGRSTDALKAALDYEPVGVDACLRRTASFIESTTTR